MSRQQKSLVDQLCDGEHDHRPPYVQEVLRRIANDRFLTREEALRRAAIVMEETARG